MADRTACGTIGCLAFGGAPYGNGLTLPTLSARWHGMEYHHADTQALLSLPQDVGSKWAYVHGGDLRAAVYLIRSRIWPYAAPVICREMRVDLQSAAEIESQLREGGITEDARAWVSQRPWVFAGVVRDVLLSHARSLEARVSPPDKWALWKPGDPILEGHPFYKAGDTELIPKDEPEAPTKPKKHTRAKRTKKR